MNRKLANALLTAATLLVSAGASAQVLEQATIPFAFTVGQRSFPPGNYVIARVGSGVVQVRGWKGKELLSELTSVIPNAVISNDPNKLVFHVYRNQYFLTEIRSAVGEPSGRLPLSRLERQLQQQQATIGAPGKTEVALSH